MNEPLAVAVEAARRGAAELEAWRSKFRIREKARADLVTDADTASQKAVKEHLLAAYPQHHFLGEEEAYGCDIESLRFAADAPPTWVCDPLDGTGNYAHGVPAYCVNIALVVKSEPVVAVTLDPRLKRGTLHRTTVGGGAFLNGEPIRVSTIASLRDALLSTGFPSDYEKQLRNLAAWQRVSKEAQALRRTGSSALNLAYLRRGPLRRLLVPSTTGPGTSPPRRAARFSRKLAVHHHGTRKGMRSIRSAWIFWQKA